MAGRTNVRTTLCFIKISSPVLDDENLWKWTGNKFGTGHYHGNGEKGGGGVGIFKNNDLKWLE